MAKASSGSAGTTTRRTRASSKPKPAEAAKPAEELPPDADAEVPPDVQSEVDAAAAEGEAQPEASGDGGDDPPPEDPPDDPPPEDDPDVERLNPESWRVKLDLGVPEHEAVLAVGGWADDEEISQAEYEAAVQKYHDSCA